eukprot:CAMPEP_0198229078 /NCGR_PEP_ID=MMETSP1445-20131203/113933_1 /TAXON_ID=36898 /ORGANISM="Pyramimonas sp., Strain CCMP2087" /LENGTH=327 /DNA_ID=CAMNT_0043909519 /DNA_START=216 /DNA_END=1199 /DNA_ORIENTATION=-
MAENPVYKPCKLSAVSGEQQAGEQGSDQMCPGVSRRDFDTCCKVLELFKQNKEAFEDPKVKPLRTLLCEFGEQFQNVRSKRQFGLSDEDNRARQTCKMGSPWEHIPPDVAGEVMEQLKWDRGASAVFRKICKGWRDAHDESVTRLTVSGNPLPGNFMLRMRFPRVKDIGVRPQSGARFGHTLYNDQWLRTLTGLTGLTSIDLTSCQEVSDNGLRTLAGLTTLTSLNLSGCFKVSGDGLQALVGLTALTSLNLAWCEQVSDDGLRSLAGLTTLTSLDLAYCDQVSDNGLHALAGLTALTSLQLKGCEQVSDNGLSALETSLPNLIKRF